jgi:hypothetical protein
MSLAGAPSKQAGNGHDRSKADDWWCYLALQCCWSVEDTEAKLLEVSEKARQRVHLGDPVISDRQLSMPPLLWNVIVSDGIGVAFSAVRR